MLCRDRLSPCYCKQPLKNTEVCCVGKQRSS